MSDFVLNYGILEEIAKTSDLLSRQADEYADQLTGRIANAISNVTGSSSGYLEDASYYVNAKIEQLRKKSREFSDFAAQINTLAEMALRVDEEVGKLLAESQKEFLSHHESLRIDNWKAGILNWLIDTKNKFPVLDMIGNVISTGDTILTSCKNSIKSWYNCKDSIYLEDVADAALAFTLFATTFPFFNFAVACGAIGAGIAAANTILNIATHFTEVYTTYNRDEKDLAISYKSEDFKVNLETYIKNVYKKIKRHIEDKSGVLNFIDDAESNMEKDTLTEKLSNPKGTGNTNEQNCYNGETHVAGFNANLLINIKPTDEMKEAGKTYEEWFAGLEGTGKSEMSATDKLVASARMELGFKENTYINAQGKEVGDNKTPYGEWYGLNRNPWCAMFVSYVAHEAGILETKQSAKDTSGNILAPTVPKFAAVSDGVKWYKSNERFESKKSGYEPKAGDLIFFTNKGQNHVGIVTA